MRASRARGGRRKRQGQVEVAPHDVGQPRHGGEQPPRAAVYLDGVGSVDGVGDTKGQGEEAQRQDRNAAHAHSNGRDRPSFLFASPTDIDEDHQRDMSPHGACAPGFDNRSGEGLARAVVRMAISSSSCMYIFRVGMYRFLFYVMNRRTTSIIKTCINETKQKPAFFNFFRSTLLEENQGVIRALEYGA